MKPTSWTRALIGICCVLPLLWLVPEVVLSLLYDPYVTLTTTRSIVLHLSLASGFLLLGAMGASLLTGKYDEHQKAFHRIWLALGVLAAILFISVWIPVTTVR